LGKVGLKSISANCVSDTSWIPGTVTIVGRCEAHGVGGSCSFAPAMGRLLLHRPMCQGARIARLLHADVETKIVTLAQLPLRLYVREFIVSMQNLGDCNRPNSGHHKMWSMPY